MLDWHVQEHPDHIHVTVLQDENTVLGTMSYRDLQTAARAVAQGLISRDIVPGDRIAMMLPTSTDFFASFFGILYAGAVPVPIYPPARMAQLEEHMRRQIVILNNAGARMLITVPEGRKLAVLLRSQVQTLESVETVTTLSAERAPLPLPPLNDPEALGLMQYTSGSTGDPEGRDAHALGPAGEHALDGPRDGGLVEGHIRELAAALSRHGADRRVARLLLFRRAALCDVADRFPGAPSHLAVDHAQIPRDVFGRAELRVRAVREPHPGRRSGRPRPVGAALRGQRRRADLAADLAQVHRALRQIRHETAASPSPSYGLAENCVGLCFPPFGRGPQIDRIKRESLAKRGYAEPAGPEDTDAIEMVACGHPIEKNDVRIVDDAGHEVGERHEGMLEFRGPSMTKGYFRNEAKTQRAVPRRLDQVAATAPTSRTATSTSPAA